MIVDVHSHLFPREMVPPNAVAAMTLMSDVEWFLQAQAESPVDFSVISQPMLMEARLKEGRGAARPGAALQRLAGRAGERATPTALPAWPCVYPQGGDPFLREFERCVRELDMRGVMVCPRYGDLFLDSPESQKFLALASQLDVPVYLHPPGVTFAKGSSTRAAWTRRSGGLRDRRGARPPDHAGRAGPYPTLKIVASHVGGRVHRRPGAPRV